jgi:hypothetical protein
VKVKYDGGIETDAAKAELLNGLVELRRKGIGCDCSIVASSGGRFQVHQLVLSAHSPVLREKASKNGPLICSADHEVCDVLVRWLYGEVSTKTYRPSSRQANSELLRIAHEFQLPKLAELCGLVIAKSATVEHFVNDVLLCESYGLPRLRTAMVQAIVADRAALDIVSRDPLTLEQPVLMRELLAGLASAV